MFHDTILGALLPLVSCLVAAVPSRRPILPDAIQPGFRQPPLPFRQRPGYQFDGINAEDTHIVLVVSVEVWSVMRSSRLHEHTDDDTEEATEFWH
jgi:hypothetical protein